jgi:hypothetical protein
VRRWRPQSDPRLGCLPSTPQAPTPNPQPAQAPVPKHRLQPWLVFATPGAECTRWRPPSVVRALPAWSLEPGAWSRAFKMPSSHPPAQQPFHDLPYARRVAALCAPICKKTEVCECARVHPETVKAAGEKKEGRKKPARERDCAAR